MEETERVHFKNHIGIQVGYITSAPLWEPLCLFKGQERGTDDHKEVTCPGCLTALENGRIAWKVFQAACR